MKIAEKKIGIIFNLKAGRIKKGNITKERLEQIIASNDGYGVIKEINKDANRENKENEVYSILREFEANNINIVAIAGGDGTLHKTLTAIRKYAQNNGYSPYVSFQQYGSKCSWL